MRYLVVLVSNLCWATLSSATCYEPNEAHPLPDYDPEDPLLQATFGRIHAALEETIAAPQFDATSFSVEITSSKKSLWSQHHTALKRNASRPDIPEVNGGALYRIASITKSFTVLGMLYQHAAGKLNLDDSIADYVEELQGKHAGELPWKDITLRSLASQLSGIPRDFAQGDLINAGLDWDPISLGLPPVSRKGLLQCDEYGDNYKPACNRTDLIDTLVSLSPMFAPNQKSSYSNIAFELIGLAVANVTNQTYESYIEDAIFKPLNMSKSTFDVPADSAGVIPFEPQYWDVDEGIQNPTGGIYSSSSDLSKYLRYVLTHFNGITHALNWAHPVSPGEGLYSFYGTPWEIFRTDKILLNSKRPVRFITKGGGLPGYFSMIMTIPEYDLGITILVAGDAKLLMKLIETVTFHAVRGAEEVAIQQLKERYTGRFVSGDPNLNSSITTIADHRGLVIDEFISNGTDVLNSRLKLILGAKDDDRSWYALLVPTLLFSNETEQEGEQWRIIGVPQRLDENPGIWDDFCVTNIDRGLHAAMPVNEVVLWIGDGKVAETLELPAFRVKLSRTQGYPASGLRDDQQERIDL